MDDLTNKLSEIESICEKSRDECDDMEHTAVEIEGYAENIKRDAAEARTKLFDAMCLVDEVKELTGRAQELVQGDPLSRLSLAIVSVVGMTALDRIQYCTPSAAKVSHNLNSDHWFIGTQVPLCS